MKRILFTMIVRFQTIFILPALFTQKKMSKTRVLLTNHIFRTLATKTFDAMEDTYYSINVCKNNQNKSRI